MMHVGLAFVRRSIVEIGLLSLISLLLLGFFSYRLLEVPPGLTSDEISLGLNASLLSQTGRDESGRLLPVFVLSDGDWKQPVTQYYLVILYYLFGGSVWLLRFSGTMLMVLIGMMLYLLGKRISNRRVGVASALVFLTAPIVMIHSHYGLDNQMPLPFIIVWLWSMWEYQRSKRRGWLVLAGIALGICFYSYKAMRAMVPIWTIISVGYIAWLYWSQFKQKWGGMMQDLLFFGLGGLPFVAAIPYFNARYAGAVFNGQENNSAPDIYEFMFRYLSNFDVSFLFIRGDIMLHHSTQKHGMLLLAVLPLLIVGLLMLKKWQPFSWFVLTALLLGPLFLGYIDSFHRASRLFGLLPMLCLICGWGFDGLWSYDRRGVRTLAIGMTGLLMVNFAFFVAYYHYDYAGRISTELSGIEKRIGYMRLSELATSESESVFIDKDLFVKNGNGGQFYTQLYFGHELPAWLGDETSGLVLTEREVLDGYEMIESPIVGYYIHRR